MNKAKGAGQWGSVSFVQRFGSALNLNPHFHTLMLDGVCVTRAGTKEPEFVEVEAPVDEEIRKLTETVASGSGAIDKAAGEVKGKDPLS